MGSSTCDSEREIHVGGLGAVGADCFPGVFAYVALGHLHRPQAAGGREVVRYAGSPIPLSFSEAGDAKEARLLDFVPGGLLCQAALRIPVSRPLAQIHTRRESLEADLAAFQPPAGALPAWVEVVVSDPVPGENLFDRVQEMAKGREFKVIQVVCRRTTPLPAMTASEQAAAEGIDQLLGDPVKTFDHRLQEEPGLIEAERAALKIAFAELCNLHAEQQRD
jgi:exonuclease SbcD